MGYEDAYAILGEILCKKGLAFWQMFPLLESPHRGVDFTLQLFECIGFLPGRDKGGRDDPARPIRRRLNAFKLAVHPDKLQQLTLHLDALTKEVVFKAANHAMQALTQLSALALSMV